jgi:L-ribulose-5-phosphate 3-epimerase
MFLAYNTNGFAHHELLDALAILAEIGYRGVGITIDHGVLSPRERGRGPISAGPGTDRRLAAGHSGKLDFPPFPSQLPELKRFLKEHAFRSVIETGARFLLDPRRKHEPTLVSPDPRPRIDFYKHAIDCAAELGSDCVSLWSGRPEKTVPSGEIPAKLVRGLEEVLDYAEQSGVDIGFEPEPGMLIDSLAAFENLLKRIAHPRLRLTLDIGHLQCGGEVPISRVIHRWAPRLVNVHVEDMRRGRHEHLRFGEGEIAFPPVLKALADGGYTGGVCVELPRHSHEAPEAARQAYQFLNEVASQVGIKFSTVD